MRSAKSLLLLLAVLPGLMFMAVEEEHHGADPMAFVGKVVNFVVLFGGLGLLLYKPLSKYLGTRGAAIDRTLRETRESRRKAEARLQEARSRLDALAGEIARIREEADSLGTEEKNRILAEAELEADRLQQLAHKEIELVSQHVKRDLRRYAAELATRRARERLQARMTPERHTLLIDQSISRLERLYEKSGSD
jgi:F-type H+-transporting ATPase subunit b